MRRRMYIMSGVLMGGAALVAAWCYYVAPFYTVKVTPAAQVVVSRRSAVDEPAPTTSEKQDYTVSADMPRYLRIKKIGVEARVLALGRDKNGAIGVPPGIWDVAWYTGSAKPGQSGVTFIDGHISGPNLPAVFKDLQALAAGDVVSVERGDGRLFDYHVRSVQLRPIDTLDMDQLLTKAVDDKSTLILMTCGGDFNARQYTYDERVVVVATEA